MGLGEDGFIGQDAQIAVEGVDKRGQECVTTHNTKCR